MIPSLETLADLAATGAPFLLDLALKTTLMLGGAIAIASVLRRASASLRSLLWSATIGALLALPALMMALPAWRTALLPELVRQRATPPSALEAPTVGTQRETTGARIERVAVPAPRTLAPPAAPARDTSLGWGTLVVIAWAAGAFAVAAWYATGQLQALRMTRRARLAQDPALRVLIQSLGRRLDVRRDVRVLHSRETNVPLTWGFGADVVILPEKSAGESPATRETVLLHELEHVRRRDCIVQLAVQLACALYWFHPMAWYVALRLRSDRERACDDAVLEAGGDAHEYAAELVRLARDARRLPAGVIAMARPSRLEGRLLSILDERVARGRPSRRAVRRALALAAILVVPLAAVRPLGAAAAAPSEERSLPLEGSPVIVAPPSVAAPTVERATRPAVSDSAIIAAPSVVAAAETIVVAPSPDAPLAERWAWALREAERRGESEVWIGYGLEARGRHWSGLITDSEGTSLSDRLTRGVPLGAMIRATRAGAPVGDVAVLLLVSRDDARTPRRVRVWTTSLNVELDRRPLLWLGIVSDAESVPHLRAMYERTQPERVRKALVTAISVHGTAALAMPFLRQVLEGNASTEIRQEAVEGIGFHDGEESLHLLARLARGDPSGDVRTEAAEALGMLTVAGTADTLVALTAGAGDVDVRVEAAETIGELEDPRVEAILERIALSEGHVDVMREAVEALGDLDGARGMAQLDRIARQHPRAEVRAEALESLAEKPERDVLPMLRRAAFEDPSERVQAEAVETLEDIDSSAAREILREIEERHPSARIRREAAERRGR